MKDFTSDSDEARWNGNDVKTVVLGNGVTSIGDYAFEKCYNLESIEIPDGVTSIGYKAFKNCESLTSIEIPDSVTSIGKKAFSDCKILESIDISDSVTSIGVDAFERCYCLKSIKIPDGVTSIGEGVFQKCTSLTSIDIPDGVTSIGAGAFIDCEGLTSIDISDSVKTIGYWAFAGCNNLETISFGNGIVKMGDFDEEGNYYSAFAAFDEAIESYISTKFYKEDGVTEIDPETQIEEFKGQTFAGTIEKMVRTLQNTVTIDDGSGSLKKYTGYVGQDISAYKPADPTMDGYEFQYWQDQDGNEFDWKIHAGNVTITPCWKSTSEWSGDDDWYPSHNPYSDDSSKKTSDDSTDILLIVACIATFMAILTVYTYNSKR